MNFRLRILAQLALHSSAVIILITYMSINIYSYIIDNGYIDAKYSEFNVAPRYFIGPDSSAADLHAMYARVFFRDIQYDKLRLKVRFTSGILNSLLFLLIIVYLSSSFWSRTRSGKR
jgi:hypothetical protein